MTTTNETPVRGIPFYCDALRRYILLHPSRIRGPYAPVRGPVTRLARAKAWADLARARLAARDALASQALDVARSLYAAVPVHDVAKAEPEEIIAGALIEFAQAYADAEREHSRAAVEAALRGAVDAAGRVLARIAADIKVSV